MKYLVNGVLVAMVLVAALLAWRLFRPVEAPVPSSPAPGAERCDEATRPIPVLRPDLTSARLVLAGSVPLELDGRTPGATLPAGLHTLTARDAKLEVRVEPFAEVVVQTFEVGGVAVILFFGATCATCTRAETKLELDYQRGPVASAKLLARAVAQGDWQLGADQLRAMTPADRQSLELRRLMAAVHVLAGQPTLARELLLPDDPLVRELEAREEREADVAARQLATAPERWNAVTDRFQRLTETFASDAPEPMTTLSNQFKGFTKRMLDAKTDANPLETELVLQEATDAVTRAVGELRVRDASCRWQRRIWASL